MNPLIKYSLLALLILLVIIYVARLTHNGKYTYDEWTPPYSTAIVPIAAH